MPGPDEAETVDLRMVHRTDGDRRGAPPDEHIQALALRRRQELGVIEPRDPDADREDDSPTHDWSRERTHAHLVDARHDLVAHGACHAFVAPEHRPAQTGIEVTGVGTEPPGA